LQDLRCKTLWIERQRCRSAQVSLVQHNRRHSSNETQRTAQSPAPSPTPFSRTPVAFLLEMWDNNTEYSRHATSHRMIVSSLFNLRHRQTNYTSEITISIYAYLSRPPTKQHISGAQGFQVLPPYIINISLPIDTLIPLFHAETHYSQPFTPAAHPRDRLFLYGWHTASPPASAILTCRQAWLQ
jgi:hypothetical protein